MVAQYARKLEGGEEYDHLIPSALFKKKVISVNSDLNETVEWIKAIIYGTLEQTKRLAFSSELGLKNKTLYQKLEILWNFAYRHIQYREDEKGKEQLHTPARIWAKRKIGVDCDDFTIWLASLLTNLKIRYFIRLAEYEYKGFYQHVYVCVYLPNGKYITLDPVKDRFNQEHPYTNYYDIDMPLTLEVLSGLNGLSGLFGTSEQEALGDAILKISDVYRSKLRAFLLQIDKNKYSEAFSQAQYVATNNGKIDTNALVLAENMIFTDPMTIELLVGQKINAQNLQTRLDETDNPAWFSKAWFKKNQKTLFWTGVGTLVFGGIVWVSFVDDANREAEKEAKAKDAKSKKKDAEADNEDEGVSGYKTKRIKNELT